FDSAGPEMDFMCSVCFEVFEEPVSLPCGHTFCKSCIDSTWQGEHNMFSCPNCRTCFTSRPKLQRNVVIAAATRALTGLKISNTDVPPEPPKPTSCDSCLDTTTPAIKICLKCEMCYCEAHVKAHENLKGRHVMISVMGGGGLHGLKCPQHEEFFTFYCKDDKTFICTTCAMAGKHTNHKVSSVENAMMEMKVVYVNSTCLISFPVRASLYVDQTRSQHSSSQLSTARPSSAQLVPAQHSPSQLSTARPSSAQPIPAQHSLSQLSTARPSSAQPVPAQHSPSQLSTARPSSAQPVPAQHSPSQLITAHPSSAQLVPAQHSPSQLSTAHPSSAQPVPAQHSPSQLSTARPSSQSLPLICRQPYEDLPSRFILWGQVMASKGFHSGRHYWVVDVSKADQWSIGIAYSSLSRRKIANEFRFGQNALSWCLYKESRCMAKSNGKEWQVPHQEGMKKVGVFLDFNLGSLIFYNAETMASLFQFRARFTEPVFPVLTVVRCDHSLRFVKLEKDQLEALDGRVGLSSLKKEVIQAGKGRTEGWK
uniref:Uncharacterized protein n=1 Tax=Eptatretus burgeri TaxID=7764 RepID=A0A8C4N999_EPTBU